MEGILYYLKKTAVDALFDLFNTQLPSHSQLGFVTWPPRIQNSTTMEAVQNLFEVELGFPKKQYTWLEDTYIQQWKNLDLLQQTNYVQLEQKYGTKPYKLTFENIVNEAVFLMERK